MKLLRTLIRAWLLSRLLDYDERQMLAALRTYDRWQPAVPITHAEAEQWGAWMDSQLGVKIDAAMQLAIQQQAQRSCLAPAPQLPYAAGFAAGMRAGWAVAQSISGAVADSTEPESVLPASAGLDHLMP